MRLHPGWPLLAAAMMISACAGPQPVPIPAAPARVEQLPFPQPPQALLTPLARPPAGYLSTLPSPPLRPPMPR